MAPGGFTLILHPDRYAIARLDPDRPIPEWARQGPFVTISKTRAETSIVCPEAACPPDVRHVKGRRLLEFSGPIPFETTGVLDAVLAPLARAAISVFVLSTFDTDYIMVTEDTLDAAIGALRAAGHTISA